jgi:hypothetical protein
VTAALKSRDRFPSKGKKKKEKSGKDAKENSFDSFEKAEKLWTMKMERMKITPEMVNMSPLFPPSLINFIKIPKIFT